MIRRTLATVTLACAAALLAGACRSQPEEVRRARAQFEELRGVNCPGETRKAIARRLDAKSADIRILHYGVTGKPDSTHYFAALSRDGAYAVGIIDEAWVNITKIHYRGRFTPDEFVWAVRCIYNDAPFNDRQVRFGLAFPVRVVQGTRAVRVDFVDGWLPEKQKWSVGHVWVNLAGTLILDETHATDFIFRPGKPPAAAADAAATAKK